MTLFDDQGLSTDDALAIEQLAKEQPKDNDPFWLNRILQRIGDLDAKNERLSNDYRLFMQKAEEFFVRKQETIERQKNILTSSLDAYMQANELQSISVPAGNAHYRRSKKVNWPAEPVLLEWAKDNAPQAIRTDTRVNKTVLKDVIKKTGNKPEGYEEIAEAASLVVSTQRELLNAPSASVQLENL